jgi:hypothetical protein
VLAGLTFEETVPLPTGGGMSPNQLERAHDAPGSRSGLNSRVDLFFDGNVFHLGYRPGFKEALPTVQDLAATRQSAIDAGQ